MKNIFAFVVVMVFASNSLFGQSSGKAIYYSLKTAETVSDIKGLLDGDTVSSLCSIMSGNPILCGMLSVSNLNSGEDEEIAMIKSRYELEEFLKSKGVSPQDFYRKLYEVKDSSKFERELLR